MTDVSAQIAEWLERDREPQDIYELLGKKRLDPDIKGLRAAISEASREILPYQSHADSKIAQRAMRLLTDLGGADLVVADSEKLEQHNRQILDMLFDEYATEHGEDVSSWDWNDLKRWLLRDKTVHPLVIEDALTALCPKAQLRVVRPEDVESVGEVDEPRPRRGRRREEEYDTAEMDVPVRRSRPRADTRRRRAGSSRAAGSSATRDASRSRRHFDGFSDMLDDLGVQAESPTRRSSRSRRSRSGRRRKKQVRYSYSSSAPAWFKISVITVAVLVLAAIGWSVFGPQEDRSGTVIITVSPASADATVTVNRDDIRVEKRGDRWFVTIEDAEVIAGNERVTILIRADGFTERTLDWGPQPRQTSEKNVTLYVADSPDSGAAIPPPDGTAFAQMPGHRPVEFRNAAVAQGAGASE